MFILDTSLRRNGESKWEAGEEGPSHSVGGRHQGAGAHTHHPPHYHRHLHKFVSVLIINIFSIFIPSSRLPDRGRYR